MRLLNPFAADIFLEGYRPLVCAIRSLQDQAQMAGKTAAQTGGAYGSEATGIYGNITPTLEKWTTAPPGYAPQDLAAMETAAMQSGAGAAGAARERMRLRATRTGNAAALPAQEAAATEGAARSTGGAIQDILARNAQLKSEQQRQAFGELGNMYGTAGKLGIEAQGLVPEDVTAGAKAGSTGWYQNLLAGINTGVDALTAFNKMKQGSGG